MGVAVLALGLCGVPVSLWAQAASPAPEAGAEERPGIGPETGAATGAGDAPADGAQGEADGVGEAAPPAIPAPETLAVETSPAEITPPETVPVPLAEDAYVRARLAEGDRDLPEAARFFGDALANDPAGLSAAQRGYRYAVLAGDKALALNAAKRLDAAGQLTRDGTVLLLVDALERRQWLEMLSRTDRLEAELNLAFLSPYLRSWLSLLRKDKDFIAPQMPTQKQIAALVERYQPEQTLLLALARQDRDGLETALAGVRGGVMFGPEQRALMAAHIDRMGRRDLALAFLVQGVTATAEEASTRLSRARKLYRKRPVTPQYGIAILLNRLAQDLKGQGDGIVAFSIARMASFVDSANEDIRVNLAHAALLARYPDISITEAAKVPATSVDYPDAQMVLARALIAQENFAAAEQVAQGLIAQAGKAPQAEALAGVEIRRGWRLLGDVRAQANDYPGAAEAYQMAMSVGTISVGNEPAENSQEDPSLLLQLGASLEQAGKWDAARPMLERVVELAPDSAMALNHLGYALADRKEDLPRAINLLEKANRISPDEAAYNDSLGWAYYRAGNIGKALPLLQRAVEMEPSHSELNDHLGDVLWAAGRRFEARYAWMAALVALDEDDERTPALRQQLERKRESGPEAQ
ncbi:MAG: tetratricopeptide repeat protein [Sphingobium sp.]|nr:tetratricopeptide repeat protein [Sphingobium sp.]